MYSRTIKKSITIFLFCTLLSAACLFSTAGAANLIDNPSVTATPFRAQLIYSNQDSEYGDQVIAQVGGITGTYEATVPLTIAAITNDRFIIGLSTYSMSVAFSGYEDFIIESVNIWYEASDIDSIYSTVSRTTQSVMSTSSRLVIGWENYHTVGSSFAIGNLHITISGRISSSTVRSVPRYIDCAPSIVSQANFLYSENEPQDTSFAAIIKQAILNALNTDISDTYSVVDFLSDYLIYLYAIDEKQENIDNNIQALVSDLVTVIGKQDNEIGMLQSLYRSLDQFYASWLGYNNMHHDDFAYIKDRLDEIIAMGQTETEGQSEAKEEASKLQNQIDILAGQPTLDINDVFSDIDAGAEANGQAAADIYFWTWDGKIAGLLATAMSLALIGFIVYGKSG